MSAESGQRLERWIYAIRLFIWIASIYVVSVPLRRLRDTLGGDVYVWTALAVLALGFVVGVLLAFVARRLAARRRMRS
ncbi:hypothetical protein [Arenimonas composti]|uniref:PH domain-containing protein n=1 Tax=Arenimonas composti TR7-09 = DSM 18010 TaxID=1121013 RepID=A0A091C3V7_9GAMM|nr:hypothetical protein [Arenimonas composti]KFN51335.1 hypothetical protein P873_03445 [Arenimonas composti TR7-09 = DSM 18010]